MDLVALVIATLANRACGLLSMIRYQIRPEGATIHWSPANRHRRCECQHTYAYPNSVVLAVVEERRALTKDNARLEVEVNQLRETIKMQADQIKKLEDDVVEGQERTNDLSAQLGEAQEQLVTGNMKVRTRAKSIMNICGDLLENLSDEASNIGDEAGAEPSQDGRSASPAVN